MDFVCPNCHKRFATDPGAEQIACASCGKPMARTQQVSQILETWYWPRRWYRDVPKPSLNFLLEMLWTADGQGEKLFTAVAPPNVNYQSFVHQVTRAIMKGVDAGWAQLEVPEDPFADNPIYKLSYLDSEKFADAVTALFPNVDWDETITVEEPLAEEVKG
ncbi:MAG: zinc-ribbon domain-containing protein [Chloroflexi bacterium]|nr:zinc-ribbon domain-containing protein [Chloroflexota bacterium]MCL5109513.1 zinc-ribbon domain-containing protein [Chloroflexota bacterium]